MALKVSNTHWQIPKAAVRQSASETSALEHETNALRPQAQQLA
jgi:hypothetical protein